MFLYEFNNYWYLIILIFILGFFGYHWFKKEKNNTKKLFYKNNWNKKNVKNIISIKLFFVFLGLFLLLFSLWRPRWGFENQNLNTNGLDLVFTVDVSKSMNALDFSKDNRMISRLDATKILIKDFIKDRKNDRISLVEFAGEAFVSSPLTLDYSVFLNFLDSISSDDLAKQGTNLEEALEISISRLEIKENKKRTRAIILFSDGDQTLDTKVKKLAQKAKEKNIPIYTVGIGSEKGMPIPEEIDSWGNIKYKHYKGKTVIAKLNPEPLKEIATITNGEYFHAENFSDLFELDSKLKSLPKTILNKNVLTPHSEKYWYFTLFGLIFFIIGFTIPKNISLTKNNYEK